MLLADLVATTDAVGTTRARSGKIAAFAHLLSVASPEEIGVVVGLISGSPRQGRIGVGWAALAEIDIPPSADAILSVSDLDVALSDISAAEGPGSREVRREILARLFGLATAREGDFIRRLLIGDLRQGANTGIVTDAVARATGVPAQVLRRAVMLSGDLGAAAEIARRAGREGLEQIGVRIHRPIEPMLASTSATVADAIGELGESSVEWKLDGIRIQVHRDPTGVRVWTRNLNDITARLPEVVAVAEDLDVRSIVLDGEVLGLDGDGAPLAFQDTVSNDTSGTPFFFDLLHLDGADLLDIPLRDRRARLESVAARHTVPGTITTDAVVAQAVLDEAIARGHEGVVVKAADSAYQAGRRGKVWRKVKPVHTLDLVVLAVEYGSGRRRGWLSNIHLGAAIPQMVRWSWSGRRSRA